MKYEWNGSVWNLDDGTIQLLSFRDCGLDNILTDADYTIFQWRQSGNADSPTVYLRNPSDPLPSQSSYRNVSFYLFRSDHSGSGGHDSRHNSSPVRSEKQRHSSQRHDVLKHKKEFEDFHTSNGVRTITGNIGPVQDGKRFVSFSLFRYSLSWSSAYAPQDWISLCVYLPKVCHEARLHPTRCRTGALWIQRPGQVSSFTVIFISLTNRLHEP